MRAAVDETGPFVDACVRSLSEVAPARAPVRRELAIPAPFELLIAS